MIKIVIGYNQAVVGMDWALDIFESLPRYFTLAMQPIEIGTHHSTFHAPLWGIEYVDELIQALEKHTVVSYISKTKNINIK